MGHTAEGKCLECGEEFEFSQGGGDEFHLVRCDKCGETKSLALEEIPFEELWERKIRYEKGQVTRYFTVAELDKLARIRRGERISKDEYNAAVELVAGRCGCKGKYTLNAPPRCPKCRSTNISEGRTIIYYD
jgi:predicted Zn-ribbon and HTH transcriptional regulator